VRSHSSGWQKRFGWTFVLLLFSSSIGFAALPKKVDVLIIGAGLSGLSTAYELKKNTKLSYLILEGSPRVGGRVRTVRYQRPGEPLISADSGMEEYWESNPAVDLMKELKLKLRSDFAASSIRLEGKLEKLDPEDDSESFLKRVLNKGEYRELQSFKMEVEPLYQKLKTAVGPLGLGVPPAELIALKDLSFETWVRSRVKSARVADWIRVSIECEVGTHWNRFSALDGISEFHIFLGKGELSYRVIGGNEKFTNALLKSVGQSKVALNHLVKSIETVASNRVKVKFLRTDTHEAGEVEARHVVSTIPLYRLFDVQFSPPLSEKKAQAIQSQTWGSYFKAHLFVPQAAEKFWTQQGTSFLPILSDSDLGVIYEGNPDEKTPTRIVSLLVTGDTAESFNFMSSDLVRQRIYAAFEKLWPGFSQQILGMEFYRIHPRAIAGWPVGRSRFDELSQAIRQPEHGVYLSGDFTEGTHSDGAFRSAKRVVHQIQQAEGK